MFGIMCSARIITACNMKGQTLLSFSLVCFSETKDSAVQKGSKSKNNNNNKK